MRRGEDRGNVMLIATLAMVALLLFGALAIDVGFVWSSRAQSQNAADAAALAAASTMIVPGLVTEQVDLAAARLAGTAIAAANKTVGSTTTGVIVEDSDFEFGKWNTTDRTFDPSVDTSDPTCVTAVRTKVRMDGSANSKSPAFFSRLLLRDGFEIQNTSVAYRGFEGSFPTASGGVPSAFLLPIAINSFAISSPPNSCGDVALDPTKCSGLPVQLLFSAGIQNACYTSLDDNLSHLLLVLEGGIGNPSTLVAGSEIAVSDGSDIGVTTLTMLTTDLLARLNGSATPGSLVVKLPVIQCNSLNCCPGSAVAAIAGAVCFELQQVVVGATSVIRGRFLCPSSPDPALFAACSAAGSQPGGGNFGLRARHAVLVN